MYPTQKNTRKNVAELVKGNQVWEDGMWREVVKIETTPEGIQITFRGRVVKTYHPESLMTVKGW